MEREFKKVYLFNIIFKSLKYTLMCFRMNQTIIHLKILPLAFVRHVYSFCYNFGGNPDAGPEPADPQDGDVVAGWAVESTLLLPVLSQLSARQGMSDGRKWTIFWQECLPLSHHSAIIYLMSPQFLMDNWINAHKPWPTSKRKLRYKL